MPTTFLGLVLFVALVAPGVCYLIRREARRGERVFSPLRESATVVLVGLLCDIVVLSGLAGIQALRNDHKPDLAAFLASPAKYATDNLGLIWWSSLGLLAAACILGLILGGVSLDKVGKGKSEPNRLRRILSDRLGPVEFASAWNKYLAVSEDEVVWCSCILEDGSWVGGNVRWFNTDLEESPDRDLVLMRPIRFRNPGDSDAHDLPDDLLFVSARRILFFGVTRLSSTGGPAPRRPPPDAGTSNTTLAT